MLTDDELRELAKRVNDAALKGAETAALYTQAGANVDNLPLEGIIAALGVAWRAARQDALLAMTKEIADLTERTEAHRARMARADAAEAALAAARADNARLREALKKACDWAWYWPKGYIRDQVLELAHAALEVTP